jgi:hypothetical protein
MVKDTYYFIAGQKHGTGHRIVQRFYGPTTNAGAEKTGKVEELHTQLLGLAKAHNKSTDGGTLQSLRRFCSDGAPLKTFDLTKC